jgi:hypothetical protein
MNSNTSAHTNTNSDIEINVDLVKNHTFGFHQKLELICHATRHLIDFPRRLPPPEEIVKYFKSEISRRKCHNFGAPGSGDHLDNQQKLTQLESHLTVLQAILAPTPFEKSLPTQSSVLSPFNSPPSPSPSPSQSQLHDPAYVLPSIEREPDTHPDTPLSGKAKLFLRKQETGELVPVSLEKLAAIIGKVSPSKTNSPFRPDDPFSVASPFASDPASKPNSAGEPDASADPVSQLTSLEREILVHIQPRSPLDRLSTQRLAELTELLEHYSDNQVLRVITLPEAQGGWGITTSRTALLEFRKRHEIIREKEEQTEALEIDPSAADSHLKHLLQKRLLKTLKNPNSETRDIRNLYQLKLRQQTNALNEQRLALAKQNLRPPTIVAAEVTRLTISPAQPQTEAEADTEPLPTLGS